MKVNVPDNLYRKAERAAMELGFRKTEDMVNDAIQAKLIKIEERDFIERTNLIRRMAKYRGMDTDRLADVK